MKPTAFIFTQGPHGSSAGREGLDALLATSALTEDIGVFFIGDGVFQLLPGQEPEKILSRNYIATFGLLPLYGIEQCYLCAASLHERGLTQDISWILNVTIMAPNMLRQKLAGFDSILTF